jgi:dihydroorotate dehydrogenase (NAD+) catalytic subunit
MAHMDVLIAPRTGLRLQNPVIAASGTFGYGVEFAGRMDLSGLGALICKGTTRRPRTGNAPPRLVETPAGMLNAIGLQNIGVEAVIREKAPIWAGWSLPVLVNVSGTSVEDYVEIAALLDGVPGVAGIELNISCPNIHDGGAIFGVEAQSAAAVTRAVRQTTSLPLVVKLSPNVVDIRPIAAAVADAGADAISLINTVYGMTIDIGSRRPALAVASGGLSGPAIKPYALYLVYQAAQEVDIPIIGVGGILSADDAIEFMLAGATAVEIGTALLLDPTCWQRIVADLEEWRRREGVHAWSEIVGAANARDRRRTGEIPLTGSS